MKIQNTRQSYSDELNKSINIYDAIHSEYEFNATAEMSEAVSLAELIPGQRVIDIGCGTGSLFGYLSSYQVQLFGLDISRVAIKKAKQKHPNAHLVVGAGEKIPFPNSSFDYLFCMGSLEHFFSAGLALKEFYRVLKQKGIAILLLPQKGFLLKNGFYYYIYPHLHPLYALRRIWMRLMRFRKINIQVQDRHFNEKEVFDLVSNHPFHVESFHRIPSDTYRFLTFDFILKLIK